MVTWGNTTVFGDSNKQAAGATPSLFGSTAPTTPGIAASPAPFSFAGTLTTATNPTNTAAPGSSLFSASPGATTPATSTPSLFGSASPGIATTPITTMTPSNTTTVPQQAAIQAHMTATLHQEASRLESKLLTLYNAYSPQTIQNQQQQQPQQQECKFQYIFYDPMTPNQRLEKLSYESTHHMPYPPPPPQLQRDQNNEIWTRAIANNPNPDLYIPTLLTTGAEGLHSRLVHQQSTQNLYSTYITQLSTAMDSLYDAIRINRSTMVRLKERNGKVRSRVLSLLQKLELCRGRDIVLQPSERMAFGLEEGMSGVGVIVEKVREMEGVMVELEREGEVYVKQLEVLKQWKRLMMDQVAGGGGGGVLEGGLKAEVDQILNRQRDGVEELWKVLKKDERDLEIVKKDPLGGGGGGAAATASNALMTVVPVGSMGGSASATGGGMSQTYSVSVGAFQ